MQFFLFVKYHLLTCDLGLKVYFLHVQCIRNCEKISLVWNSAKILVHHSIFAKVLVAIVEWDRAVLKKIKLLTLVKYLYRLDYLNYYKNLEAVIFLEKNYYKEYYKTKLNSHIF